MIDDADCDAAGPDPEPATSMPEQSVCGTVQFVFTGMGTGLYEISIDRETGALHGFLQDPDEANRLEIAADAPSVLSLAELASVTEVLAAVTVGRTDVECDTDLMVDGAFFELALGDVRFSELRCGDRLDGEEHFETVVEIFRSHAAPPALPPESPTARCEELGDATVAKMVECGFEDPGGESFIESCTDEEFAALECITDCVLDTACDGLTGENHEAAMGLAACSETCPEVESSP